jgi:hypothetical protein
MRVRDLGRPLAAIIMGVLLQSQRQQLLVLHVCVCTSHFALALWAIFDGKDWAVPVTTSFVSWKKRNEDLECNVKTADGVGNCYVSRESYQFKNLADISLTQLVVAFHFLSLSWQALVLVSVAVAPDGLAAQYYREVALGRNTMRWIEYSLSAPLMTVVIGVLLGQLDIVTLFLLAVCTWVLMAFGYLHEVLNASRIGDSRASDLVPHVTGWLLFCMTWFALGFPFFLSLEVSDAKAPAQILPVIYAVFFMMLSFYATFGVAQLWHATASRRAAKSDKDLTKVNLQAEIVYTALSLASKTALGVLLYWGIRTRDEVLQLEVN